MEINNNETEREKLKDSKRLEAFKLLKIDPAYYNSFHHSGQKLLLAKVAGDIWLEQQEKLASLAWIMNIDLDKELSD